MLPRRGGGHSPAPGTRHQPRAHEVGLAHLLDGAGFLTNGAAVAIKEAAKPAATLTPNPSPATGEGSVVSR